MLSTLKLKIKQPSRIDCHCYSSFFCFSHRVDAVCALFTEWALEPTPAIPQIIHNTDLSYLTKERYQRFWLKGIRNVCCLQSKLSQKSFQSGSKTVLAHCRVVRFPVIRSLVFGSVGKVPLLHTGKRLRLVMCHIVVIGIYLK